jgi:outer membrane protein TolC
MWRFVVVIVAAVLIFPGGAGAQSQRPVVTIGIVADGPWERHADLTELVRSEIIELLSNEFDVRLPSEKYAEADWTLAGVRGAIDRVLTDEDVDMVVTMGPIGSHEAASRADLPKPVIAPIILDAELQNLPSEGGGSGVRNLTYIALPANRDLQVFREIVPFNRIALLVNGPLAEAIPGMSEDVRRATEAAGLEPTVIPVEMAVEPVLTALDAADVEAVYVLPQMQLGEPEWGLLIAGLIERDLPSFSWMGRREVAEGIFAGRRPERFFQRIARRVATNIQRILLGEEPKVLQTGFAVQERLVINMGTARAIGVYPPWKVVTEAELIDDVGRRPVRELSLERVVREALEANLELSADRRGVAAGAKTVRLSSSILWPQIDVAADWSVIDEDQAALPVTQPERVLTGSATATWLVLDEQRWSDYSVQKSVQVSREQGFETLRLDIVQEAAIAYLNVLRAETFERIERGNLRVTRENLELAEIRRSIGAASPGEVYRWENQIANNRQAVIDVIAQRNVAEIELNRILNRPLEESFSTSEADINDPGLARSQQRLYEYMDNRLDFRIFRRFMAEEALGASPEIKSINALAAAERRTLQSANRSFYLPSAAVQAGLTDLWNSAGAGSDLVQDFGLTWSVGLNISYPLFTGAARFAERGRAAEQLAQLETQRDAVAQLIEQRVRSSLHQMGASLANIELSAEAAEAANNAFQLVQDSYSRGRASIVDLLDAQNSALVADLLAATAVYDYLIDFINVERATGRYDFFRSEEDREAFFDRLERFFQQAQGQ